MCTHCTTMGMNHTVWSFDWRYILVWQIFFQFMYGRWSIRMVHSVWTCDNRTKIRLGWIPNYFFNFTNSRNKVRAPLNRTNDTRSFLWYSMKFSDHWKLPPQKQLCHIDSRWSNSYKAGLLRRYWVYGFIKHYSNNLKHKMNHFSWSSRNK